MSCTNLPWAPGAWSEAGTEILLSTQPEEQGPHWEPSINHALSSALQGKSCLTEGHGDSCHMLFGLAVGTPLCPVDEGTLFPGRLFSSLLAVTHFPAACMYVHAASGHSSSTASPELLNPAWTCPSSSCSPAGMSLEVRCCWRLGLGLMCGNKPRTTTVHPAWGSGEPELKVNFLFCLSYMRLGTWLSPAGILHAPPGVIPSSRPPAKVQEGGDAAELTEPALFPLSHLSWQENCPHISTKHSGCSHTAFPALHSSAHSLPPPMVLLVGRGGRRAASGSWCTKLTWLGVPTGFQPLTLLGMKFLQREREEDPSPKTYLCLYFQMGIHEEEVAYLGEVFSTRVIKDSVPTISITPSVQ